MTLLPFSPSTYIEAAAWRAPDFHLISTLYGSSRNQKSMTSLGSNFHAGGSALSCGIELRVKLADGVRRGAALGPKDRCAGDQDVCAGGDGLLGGFQVDSAVHFQLAFGVALVD